MIIDAQQTFLYPLLLKLRKMSNILNREIKYLRNWIPLRYIFRHILELHFMIRQQLDLLSRSTHLFALCAKHTYRAVSFVGRIETIQEFPEALFFCPFTTFKFRMWFYVVHTNKQTIIFTDSELEVIWRLQPQAELSSESLTCKTLCHTGAKELKFSIWSQFLK